MTKRIVFTIWGVVALVILWGAAKENCDQHNLYYHNTYDYQPCYGSWPTYKVADQ